MAQDFARKLYTSAEWVKLRAGLIAERGPKCEQCGKLMPDTSKLIGHHIKELTIGNIDDIDITLNPTNIKLICLDCHNKQHNSFNGTKRHRVYLVYGAPCSGKAALVNQLANRGDMIFDIDKMFEAISGLTLYDKPDALRYNVFALRDKMYDMIRTRYGQWNDAYIIGTYPIKSERDRLAEELKAEMIYCDCDRDTAKGNILMDELRRPYINEYNKYIDDWFDKYAMM